MTQRNILVLVSFKTNARSLTPVELELLLQTGTVFHTFSISTHPTKIFNITLDSEVVEKNLTGNKIYKF